MKIIFKLIHFLSFICISLWSAGAWTLSHGGGVCLHPIEQAALLHGKSENQSLEGKIERAENNLEELEEAMESLSEDIDKIKTDMSNNLKEDQQFPKVHPEDMVEVLSRYMEEQHDDLWEGLSDMQLKDQDKEDVDIDGQIDLAALPWFDDEDIYFKNNGEIKAGLFCKDYSNKTAECKEALEELQTLYEDLADLKQLEAEQKKALRDWKRTQRRIDVGLADEEETEASGLCFECLDAVRELDKPTTGQLVGSALSILAGGALAYYGHRAGKSATRDINDTRLRQGYDPVSSAGLSWAAIGMGLPFISQGIYGLAGGDSAFGNWACSPGFAGGAGMYSPFGHYGGMGGAFPYAMPGGGIYAGLGGALPFPGGFAGWPYGGAFPGAGAGIRIGGGFGGGFPGGFGGFPYGAFPGAGAGIQIGGGFGGGFPGGFGGFPYGAFPGAGAGIQIGGGFGGGFPGGFGGWPYGGAFPGAGAGIRIGGGFGGPGIYGGGGMGLPFPGMGGYGGMMGGTPPFFPPGIGGGYGGGMMMPQVNLQAQYQQQQYAQYLKFQQEQMQAQLKAQQAWLQHQQSIQQDWVNRQQVIGGLTQELYKIQQQIQIVASGGAGGSVLGAGAGSLSMGVNLGNSLAGQGGPTHSPAPAGRNSQDGWEIIDGR